jgi:hypothetical protein
MLVQEKSHERHHRFWRTHHVNRQSGPILVRTSFLPRDRYQRSGPPPTGSGRASANKNQLAFFTKLDRQDL